MNNVWFGVTVLLIAAGLLGAFQMGKSSVYHRLSADQVTIVKEGRDVDIEVYQADDDVLCLLLGGCLLAPD